MASKAVIARRYAKALFDLAESPAVAKQWLDPLAALSEALEGESELAFLFGSPAIAVDQKLAVMNSLAEKLGAPKNLQAFLAYVVKAQRMAAFKEIVEGFKLRLLESERTVEVVVETAITLTEAQRTDIHKLVAAFSGKQVNLVELLKPELIAGLRVSFMGKTLDASLAANLAGMQRQLISAEA